MTNNFMIRDFITGKLIKATVEELEAVQIFARQLVEDYKYPKSLIHTKPKWRIKTKSSRKTKSVDIVVFREKQHKIENMDILVDCQTRTMSDGIKYLKTLLETTPAKYGVWFNGKERVFLYKTRINGKTNFKEIPNIPKYKQGIHDIGTLLRKDLVTTHNLKPIFRSIRNHLAGNAIGTTRDEVFTQQIINMIFCKIHDEKTKAPNDHVEFCVRVNEDPDIVKQRITMLFENVKKAYSNVFESSDAIKLDSRSIAYVVGELQNYALLEIERDVIADAFETFIGPSLKGAKGQFFTPRNVVKMMVEILDPDPTDIIIDPACGSGGFLVEVLKYLHNKKTTFYRIHNQKHSEKQGNTLDIGNTRIIGLEKDEFLTKIAKAYMAIIGEIEGGVFCEDSLENPSNWQQRTRKQVHLGTATVLLTNPPFGSKIPVQGKEKLSQYELAHKWRYHDQTRVWEKTTALKSNEAPQILFIERSLQLLANGGRMAIVLPQGLFGNESLGYIRQWLLEQGRIIAIIDVPLETFLPHTATKTSILIFQKLDKQNIPEDYPIFMAIAKSCGHDRRGKPTKNDDISKIGEAFKSWAKEHGFSFKNKDNGG